MSTQIDKKKEKLNELLQQGKSKGVMTYDEIITKLSTLEIDPEQFDMVLETLEAMGVDVGRSEVDYIRIYSTGYLKSDVLQVAHHGINMLAKLDKFCAPKYALIPNGIENQKKRWIKQYEYFEKTFPKNGIHYAGDYITAIEVTGGNETLTKIPRYDNHTGKID